MLAQNIAKLAINKIPQANSNWSREGRGSRKVPAGERSRAVNQALRAWIIRRQRKDPVREMDALRTDLPKVSTDEIARWIESKGTNIDPSGSARRSRFC